MRKTKSCLLLALLVAGNTWAVDYHLDCAHGSDSASGLTPRDAWHTISRANQQTFQPGERLLLKRDTECMGSLAPQGQGEPNRPIELSAYGEGSRPRITATGFDSGVRLRNQSHWRVRDITVRGSQVYGLLVLADTGVVQDIELRDVTVQDVHGPLTTKNSGLIVVQATNNAALKDVLIDGVIAERTTQWAGILVTGSKHPRRQEAEPSRNVIVRNSIVSDVWGDGIIIWQLKNGVIERSAAWKTGMQPRQTIGTPNGVWTWSCVSCTVKDRESFWSDSPGVDGGAFDIDWGNEANVVERSYGHDTLSYCIAVFGAMEIPTTASVVRSNVCAGLGRSPRLARHHGAIHLTTWDGGLLDRVTIEDNWIEWDPPVKALAIKEEAQWTNGRSLILRRNTVHEGARPATERPAEGSLTFWLDDSADARGLRVLLESAKAQYSAKHLRVLEQRGSPRIEYRDGSGALIESWKDYHPASEVLWRVRQDFGPPTEW